MEKLHELMGPTLSLIVLGMLGVVLIWLILKARKQGANKNPLESKVQDKPVSVDAVSEPDNSSRVQTLKVAANSAVDVAEPINKPAVVIQPSLKSIQFVGVPEDSVLRRHYLTEQAAKKVALSHPLPTDSILRRHYEAMQQPVVVTRQHPKKVNTIEQAIHKEASAAVLPAEVKPTQPVATSGSAKQVVLPEDSVLKRHVLSQLQANIRSGFAARPTDSVLRRHYDQLIGQELQKRLAK